MEAAEASSRPNSSVLALQTDGQLPRRYPTRIRVSAVDNLSNGCAKDSPDSLSNGGTQSQGSQSSKSKKRKKEEAQHENETIEEDNLDDREASVCPESGDLIVLANKSSEEVLARRHVRVALSMFQTIYQKLLQVEESKLKQPGHGMSIVITAYKLFREKNNVLDARKYLGSVPGVEIGDEFQFRVELCIANLHRQIPGCIDFTNLNGRNVAVSIVSYGSYANYLENSNVLSCSGTGVPTEDQKLEYGNLALKNSIDAKTPVRVIRGIKGPNKVARYIYDGLFLVEKHWRKKGKNGYFVFMFQLRRMPGQPELAIKKVRLPRSRTISGLCIEDISQGEEKIPIPVVNTMDNECLPIFKYITKIIYPLKCQPTPCKGCDCIDGCSDSETCACAVKNGGEIPFNYSGALVEAKPLVYECGPNCKCPQSCHNRVSQHGIKFPLEIFKTETMGWGVRCLTSIPSGSFVCEYTGELLEDEEAQKRDSDEYLFAIGNNYYDETLWEGLSTFIPDLQKNDKCDIVEDGGFTVDASRYGNVCRFINHSCTPNLYAQNLLYDHDDKRMPHIVLFATENIPPLQELTYHYNYIIDDVHDSNGNIRKKDCYCGSFECTGRLY